MSRPRLWLSLLAIVSAIVVNACSGAAAPAPVVPTSTPPGPGAATAPATPTSQPAEATATPKPTGPITIYSGRNENLIAPLIERFQQDTGIEARVRYGDTAELAAAILEEGNNSPADVYFAQDGGALGALAAAGRLTILPQPILERVDSRFRSPSDEWVGVSGRARTVVFNTAELKEADLPDSLHGFLDPRWEGKIGWAPTNGSFQSFVTALRVTEGDDTARRWLEGIKANNPKVYKNNTAIVQAVAAGEVQVGFVNHYYLFRFIAEQGESFPARNYHPRAGDTGAMINVAGVGILNTSANRAAAEVFVDYLLTEAAQQYFADVTKEYPLVSGVATHPMLVPLDELRVPDLDLGSLADLEETLRLLQATGVL